MSILAMSRRKRHAHTGLWFLLLLFICVAVAGGLFNYIRPLPAAAAKPTALTTQLGTVSLAWPDDGATAAIGAVGYGTLAVRGSSKLPTASTAKLVTALTILKAKPLQPGQQGPMLTLTSGDVALYNGYVAQDGSVVKVLAGEQLSEYQALQALLLPSANNMADTLAVWAFGSLANYTVAANQLVQSLGLSGTTIGTDASGLSPTTTSTPSDLVQLGIAALQDPVISQIVAQPTAAIPVAGVIQNVNSLLGTDGINGIKTGNSDQAAGCYIFSAPYTFAGHTVTIVGAIMHAPDLPTALHDALPLLHSAENSFTLETPVTAGEKFGTYTTQWGAATTVVAKNSISLLAWKGVSLIPHVTLGQLNRPAAAGSQVGSIAISSGNYSTSSPLTLQRAIEPPTIWWRLTRRYIHI